VHHSGTVAVITIVHYTIPKFTHCPQVLMLHSYYSVQYRTVYQFLSAECSRYNHWARSKSSFVATTTAMDAHV